MTKTELEWRRRDRADGDPVWQAKAGNLSLTVSVACPWVWAWFIYTEDDMRIAEGDISATDADVVYDDEWDYQDVERAQSRCEAVARGMLLEEVRSAHGDMHAATLYVSDMGTWYVWADGGECDREETEIAALLSALRHYDD